MKQLLQPILVTIALFSTSTLLAQAPTIHSQPQSQTVIGGANVSFSVGASGGSESVLPIISSGTLKLWLKADAGVITVGNKVAQWQDQSPNLNHAAQSNTNLQPLLVNTAVPVSGRPVIRFDGIQQATSGDYLQGTGTVAIPSAYTSFLVYSRADRVVPEQAVAVIGIPGTFNSIRSYYIRSGFSAVDNEMAFSGWGYDYGTGFSIPSNSFRIWTDRMNAPRTLLEFFDTDGVNSFSSASATGSPAAPGAGYYVGGVGPYERNFQGDVAELIFYEGSLNETDRVAVEAYLKQKYYQSSVPGGGTLTYQWQLNGTNLTGATTTSLSISNAQPVDAGNYTVVVSNNFGGTISSNAVLAVSYPPTITAQPQNQSLMVGSNASFTVTATGTAPFSYQWSFNGLPISGATTSALSINSVQTSNAGLYSVTITNAVGSAQSDSALLDIITLPIIASQPQSQLVIAGTNVTFAVTAEATLPAVQSGNLKLWLKADKGVVAVNGRVIEWQDQSPNANHAQQANTNKQPLYVASAVPVSGRPTVRFDGVQDVSLGDWLRGTSDVGIPTGYTSFLVYLRANRTIPEQAVVGIGVPAQQGALRSYFIRNSGEMAFSGWNEDFGTAFDVPSETYRIWTDRLNDSKTLLEFFDVTATNVTSFPRPTQGLAAPNPGYYLGGLDAYTRNFAGDISELIVYQGALSDSERMSIENYLRAKYFASVANNSLSYQWLFNGTNIVGATNFSLTLTNVQPGDAGNYSVVITNLAGSTISSNALLSVHIPPSIDTQPQSQEVLQGANVSFNVIASSTNALGYQWRFNGAVISNATNSAFSITNVQPGNAGEYSVVVSDGIASVISSNATLSVNFAPSIIAQPQSKTALTGTSNSLSVTATGFPLSYQWYFSSNPISGATSATLNFTSVSTNDAGTYSVIVSNNVGSVTSSNAVLTVFNTGSAIFEDFEPGIHTNQWSSFSPTVLATNYGGFVSASHSLWFGGSGSRFAVTRPIDVSGGGVISFHLRLASFASNSSPYWENVDLPSEGVVLEYSVNGTNWVNIGTYNTTNYHSWTLVQPVLPPGAYSSSTRFRWRQFSNSGPSSDHWALDDIQITPAASAPSIVTQPQNRTVPVGTNITLLVQVTGQSPLIYQWLLNSSTVLSSTNSSLTLTNVQTGDSGDYSVVISNSFGSVTSATAVVSVLAPPSISAHPQSVSTVQGTNVSFNVTASGSAPLTYQWKFNGVTISNATDSALALTNVQGTNAGSYSVQVSNPVGIITSSNAVLSIDSFPEIVQQPQSKSVIQGTNVTFTVGVHTAAVFPAVTSGTMKLWLKADAGVVTGMNGLVSQWQDQSTNGNHAFQSNTNRQPQYVATAVPVSGLPTLRFDGIQDVNTGDWMNGTNSVGIPTGYTSFLVYLRADRTIAEQAAVGIGIPAQVGALRSYFIRNSGEMAFSGWSYDYGTAFIIPANTYRIWTDRLNDAKNVLEFFDVTETNATSFSRNTTGLITPGAGYYVGGLNTYTRNFKGDISELIIYQGALTDFDRTSIQNYLKEKYYQGGSSSTVTYQWQFNGTNIVGATNASLSLTNVQPVDAGNYSVIVSNSAGAISSANAALTVNVPPSISAQPQNQNANAGTTANFSVTVAGTAPFNYQWQKNSNNIANATNAALVLNAVQTSDAGNYRVIVTSPFGSVTSSNATLAIDITTVRVVSTNALSASSFTLPIQISALGTENAVGFSLAFDPSILTFNSLALDGGLSGAFLISNTDQLGSGKLGVAVALSSDSTFAAGTQALVHVTFNVGVATNALNTAIGFSDLPTARQVANVGAEILPSIFTDGTVAIAAVDFEGDVAPRPNGNRTLTIIDWVQVGRFAAGLDSATNSGEFRRVDCAPRSTLGNGAISVTDWVQAGRYAAGLDPLTPVGGPSAPEPDKMQRDMAGDGTRTIMLDATNSSPQTHVVSARLVAQGDENAIGFSLAFNPAILTFVSATTGGNASGAALNVNTNNLASGRVGAVLSLSIGAKFPAGTQEVIKLTFTAAPSATGTTALTFSDIPILREVSDITANSLPANYSNGNLVLSVPGPLLTISQSAGGIVLSWPASATDYVLETSSAVGSSWTNLSTSLTTNGANINATFPVGDQPQFYRLKK